MRATGVVIVDVRQVDAELRRRVAEFCAGLGFGLGNSPFRLAKDVLFLTSGRLPTAAELRKYAP